MNLQTKLSVAPEYNQIDYSSKVILMGSCFVENIGEKLAYNKFETIENPFGIIFHPITVETLITRAINDEEYTDNDIFFHGEQWKCFEVHSSLSSVDKEAFLLSLNQQLKKLQEFLSSASHIILTYGTSWVYRFIETDTIVANCHKVGQKKFLKYLLSPEEIIASIDNTATLIRDVNPKINIITTVSPIRHLKDGFVENTRSKAHLIAALHEIVDVRNRIYYFPSFEIMMDELRDYRFYSEDMIHPNNTAISIIWEKFKIVWFSEETQKIFNEIDSIQKGLVHRPFNESSDAHQAFLKDLQKKISTLQEKFPGFVF